MGEIIDCSTGSITCRGYFAAAAGGGPGIIVIQEWWGLVPHITDVCDRFAAAGYSALAPDLYSGATTTEPDEAGKLMMALNVDRAADELDGAIEFLLASDAVTSSTVGVVGYCMGGGLALVLAARRPDDVSACAPYYGLIPWEGAAPDYSRLAAPVHGHYAELDAFFGPEQVAALQATLDAAGKEAVLTIHPGVQHAFFNDTRPEVYDEATAAAAFAETCEFFTATIH